MPKLHLHPDVTPGEAHVTPRKDSCPTKNIYTHTEYLESHQIPNQTTSFQEIKRIEEHIQYNQSTKSRMLRNSVRPTTEVLQRINGTEKKTFMHVCGNI